MVEGHQCHRVAAAHRKLLLGRAFQARSPNGRFREGAQAINGKQLERIEVHGKNLFYFFAPGHAAAAAGPAAAPAPPAPPPPSTVVLHFHFGMSGAFRTMALPGLEPTPTTRLELVNKDLGVVAHLSAMTVDHGALDFYESKAALLGPDPLREDADKELLWAKVTRSRKSIGLVLMDQSMIAGVGNIYRAEILFKAAVHPETPAAAITREQFDRIWYHCVDLLQQGFVGGSIITVDPEEAEVLGRPWTRRWVWGPPGT
ncbi:hypothetical protein TSOC_012173 [Tetrabaena socialis]|uniref:DNA-(apurinic or apyrimidinic site) lyase n=1 Tax=Tetrabaena socialis TaxID=47790 RepID=A0A2J7ZNQ8_9CHLO|nr:hypothetical protein TSOC_012173 [Tetrabaena socialis]|eukprot:PNH01897.1 hypothetical protein TSOC_012173 [Tetrabaena socialis]